jgi:threonine aldolase
MFCDLRSDTLTKPTREMLEYASSADQGDDCFNEAKSVHALEEQCADLFGKEAALLLPTGTMSNQIALKILARPGDEVICDASYHVNFFEAAQSAAFSGVAFNTVTTGDGVLREKDLNEAVSRRARWTETYAKPTAVWFENSVNGKNGRALSLKELRELWAWADERKLLVYMDGARVLNACTATKLSPREVASHTDALAMCFAKGLGAPMGSVLVGDNDFIASAKRFRKWFGGSLHQSGFIAAAASFALTNNLENFETDHQNAKIFANRLINSNLLKVDYPNTNMVMFDLGGTGICPDAYVKALATQGVHLLVWKDAIIRAVFSSLVDADQSVYAADTALTQVALMQSKSEAIYA